MEFVSSVVFACLQSECFDCVFRLFFQTYIKVSKPQTGEVLFLRCTVEIEHP